MTVEEAIRAYLVELGSGVESLIGQRMYAQDAPQDADLPLVLYVTSDEEQAIDLDGTPANFFEQVFRFDCYGKGPRSYASAKAIARAVKARLLPLVHQAIGDDTVSVQAVEQEGGEDGLEPPIHAGEQGLDYCGVQLRVYWNTI